MKAVNQTLEILKDYKETTLLDIKTSIEGDAHSRHSSWELIYAWSALMRLADEKNHFVGSIIEKALNGKTISEKQAWCVAFFAKNNGLINA
jgi:hypothetical protein